MKTVMRSVWLNRAIFFLLGICVSLGGYMVGKSDIPEVSKDVEFERITCESLSVKGLLSIGRLGHTAGYKGIITIGTEKDSAHIFMGGSGANSSITVNSDGGSIRVSNDKGTSASIMAILNNAHLVLSDHSGEKNRTMTTSD